MREPRWVRGSLAAVAIAAAALLLAACSSGGGSGSMGGMSSGSQGSTTTAAPATTTGAITISNFMFMPMQATVAPGATVKVTNKDSVTHTLTATGGQFDTGDIGAGRTKTFTAPKKPGSYHYICNIHQYMTGTIIVR